MKKTNLIAASILGFCLLLTPSCKKKGCMDELAENYSSEAEKDDESCTFSAEKTSNDKLQGKWSATSYKTSGFELIPTFIESMTANFSRKDAESGSVVLVSVEPDGTTTTETNTYVVTTSGKKITIDGDVFEMTLTASSLILDYTDPGTSDSFTITFEK